MKMNNRLDKSFGPVGAFAGLIIFVFGIFLTYFYVSGAVLILIGGFFGFTSTRAIIDYNKKRVRISIDIFGIIPTGHWIQVLPTMKIGIRESNQTYRAYSQGNRALDVSKTDFRIVLYGYDGKEMMHLKRTHSLDSAKEGCEIIGNKLGLAFV